MKDVTDQVKTGEVDDEHLPLLKCICGQKFERWDFVISIYRGLADECPKCKRKFIFSNKVTIYEIE